MAKTPARDSSANSKRPLHLSGLADESGPPFLRFERDEGEQGERFFVWVAAPLTIDTDALHAAIQGDVEARGGVVRVLLEHFAYELSATEASLLARYEAKDTGPDFWREVEAAGLGFPAPALALATIPRAVGLPLDLARAPAFAPRGASQQGDVQLTFFRVGSLHYKPFNVLEPKGPLTIRDALLLAHITKRYAESGCPPDRWVRLSLNEAARCAGFHGTGGKQRSYVRAAHARMRATTYQHTARDADGNLHSLTWGPVDIARTFEPRADDADDEGRASVKLSETYAELVRGGALAYLNAETFATLVETDEYAARLWMFLETESLPRRWRYALFSAPEGEPERERDTPAIADLLRLGHWKTPRRRIAARVKQAAAVLARIDPRYTVTVEHAKERTMWNLIALRKTALSPPVDNSQGSGGHSGTLPGTPGYATGYPWVRSDEEIPARHESNAKVPSVLPSVSTVSLNPTRASALEEERLQDQFLGERPPACTRAELARLMDPHGFLADLVGSDLVEELALAVCRQFRIASAGVVCRDPARCEAQDTMFPIGLKTRNYLEKKGNVKSTPAAYVKGCIRRATPDAPDLMGRTREEAKAALYRMHDLAHSPGGQRGGAPATYRKQRRSSRVAVTSKDIDRADYDDFLTGGELDATSRTIDPSDYDDFLTGGEL